LAFQWLLLVPVFWFAAELVRLFLGAKLDEANDKEAEAYEILQEVKHYDEAIWDKAITNVEPRSG
jgi:hypothetical protein